MVIDTSPPQHGEVEARSASGGEVSRPHPTRSLRSPSTSPCWGGGVVRIARSWIGTPYVHQASVKGVGCDCLGLLRGVWRELKGPEPEDLPAYAADWAEGTGEETLYRGLARHLEEIETGELAPGDIALFRMGRAGPAKHCGIVGELILPSVPGEAAEARLPTLIHARQYRRVAEEEFTHLWRGRLASAFRL